jgi:hypothetical protein
MPAAIKPYSIAVAADSSTQNFAITFFTIPPGNQPPDPSGCAGGTLEPRN